MSGEVGGLFCRNTFFLNLFIHVFAFRFCEDHKSTVYIYDFPLNVPKESTNLTLKH